ncbi:hypothetical protein SAMN05660690_4305 [Geodermatophilus telluris]|uniref:Uncharacterized protein n=1 Tax=Geodermatophilus telluris TaxID=1190417 RepID=A0A1G6V1S5_9ACTN|nr:hypothetical protein [Geodermatophilus telluris]SDD47482.1 hypothetical protein SAMN05660690_4305 [Geodermatophilus telluris]
MTYGAPPSQGWQQQPPPPVQDPSAPGAPRPGGGFFTSLPGILTAVAGLVTAVTGAVGIYVSQGDDATGGQGTPSSTDAPAPVPEDTGGEADVGDLPADFSETSLDDEATTLLDACAAGDLGACATLLDTLATECADGYGISCDALYYLSPVGSAYEDYGATCGGRYDWTYVGVCREL